MYHNIWKMINSTTEANCILIFKTRMTKEHWRRLDICDSWRLQGWCQSLRGIVLGGGMRSLSSSPSQWVLSGLLPPTTLGGFHRWFSTTCSSHSFVTGWAMLCKTPERRGEERRREGEGRGADIKPRYEHEAAKSVSKPVNMAILTGKWNKNRILTSLDLHLKNQIKWYAYVVLILSNNILLSPGNQMWALELKLIIGV